MTLMQDCDGVFYPTSVDLIAWHRSRFGRRHFELLSLGEGSFRTLNFFFSLKSENVPVLLLLTAYKKKPRKCNRKLWGFSHSPNAGEFRCHFLASLGLIFYFKEIVIRNDFAFARKNNFDALFWKLKKQVQKFWLKTEMMDIRKNSENWEHCLFCRLLYSS